MVLKTRIGIGMEIISTTSILEVTPQKNQNFCSYMDLELLFITGDITFHPLPKTTMFTQLIFWDLD
jgi:hypothetical protein